MTTDAGAHTPHHQQPATHFQVPANEMLLDEPLCCPHYGALTLDGLAIDHHQQTHLVIRTAAARAYLGPDTTTLARRTHILLVALINGGHIHPHQAPGITTWIHDCWTAAAHEIAAATRDAIVE